MGLPSLKQNRNPRIVFILTKMSMHTIRKLTFWKVCFLVNEYSSLPLIHGQDGRPEPGHWDPSETLKTRHLVLRISPRTQNSFNKFITSTAAWPSIGVG